ncbi:transcription factor TGA2.3 [Lactuca sativa]|uniref:transcription factor TGA2.3 n=1 Tax=Lactuca sativa TaxID=4236 RepID=UPI000CB4A305|nr:transcription factor TGA2.3 [Lactuca sativa]
MQSFRTTPPTHPPSVAVTPHPLSSSDLYCHSPFYIRGDENGRTDTRFTDLGELQHSSAFHQEDAVDLSRSSIYNEIRAGNGNGVVVSNGLQFRAHHMNFGSTTEMSSIGTGVDTGQFMMQNHHKAMVVSGGGSGGGGGGIGKGHFENWGESGIADNSQQTDTSTDIDTDDKNQFNSLQHGAQDSMEGSMGKIGDQKILRRLAQNREAARKSRLRKKAYVQQLENSRLKLTQLEHELKQARQQGMLIANGDQSHLLGSNGALAFDMDYARWLEDHQRLINDVRSAFNTHANDNELRVLVDAIMSHYDEIFRLKSIAAKSDVFHLLSGMWKSPAERCFMWIGGFRSSELLKILGSHLEPLTDQQLMGICNLQQSSQQAEDALSQGMEAWQQSLVDTLSSTSGGSVDYMGQMAMAMGKLGTLENFLHQADLLRQQTLQQLHRILTTRQAARALLVINDYMSRLRALSSLWLARPKD